MRILAFGAHPDDIDFYCSGTLAKLKNKGHKIGIAISTNGNIGSSTKSMEEIAAIRKSEAMESAKILDADFYWLDYDDEFLFNSREVRLKYIDIVRQFRPDIIFSPDKDKDYHPDHTTTGQILWDIHVMPSIPNIRTSAQATDNIADLYYYDTCMGVDFVPEFYVDITSEFPTKVEMISCHKSQIDWMMDMYEVLPAEFIEIQARFRGFQSGCKYAECFRQPKFFPTSAKKSVDIFF